MGYLDNTSITVDAILTNKGRQILAAGQMLNITKFALSDDEIDYTLWNPAHTLGTNYYGAVIEDMPIVEANPDDTQMMRYKLVTLPKNAGGIPVVQINPESFTLASLNAEQVITPSMANFPGGNSSLGYTAILSDNSVATLEVAPGGSISTTRGATPGTPPRSTIADRQATLQAQNTVAAVNNFLDDEVTGMMSGGTTAYRVGTKFVVKALSNTTARQLLLTIVANETGGFKTISFTVSRNTDFTDAATVRQEA
jgi:hypothetical protein